MIKKLKSWLNILFLTVILIAPGFVFAAASDTTAIIKGSASPLDRLENTATTYGPYTTKADDTTLATTLGIIINTALSILGVIFIFIIILAGYQWMMANGNEAEVKKSKDSMSRAVIGLIVVISSYAVWTFIKTTFIAKI